MKRKERPGLTTGIPSRWRPWDREFGASAHYRPIVPVAVFRAGEAGAPLPEEPAFTEEPTFTFRSLPGAPPVPVGARAGAFSFPDQPGPPDTPQGARAMDDNPTPPRRRYQHYHAVPPIPQAGPAGPAGRPGRQGRPGIDGVHGVHGTDGFDGVHGVDGRDGATGAAGSDGFDGVHGVDGRDGRDGAAGAAGRDGAAGAAGRDGAAGAAGAAGPAGPAGVTNDAMAAHLAKLLANSTAFDAADLYDVNGNRRSLDTLVKMSKVSGIWNLLTDTEKNGLTASTGQLESGRNFIAREAIYAEAIPKAEVFVINAQGKKIKIPR